MSGITIQRVSIIKLQTDAVVNAANEGLWEGGGVCGYIFREAGTEEMTRACNEIGGCETGHAVITPGFRLPAKYVIHAVGPRWAGGDHREPELLYSAYWESLKLAMENGLHSIGFPLISAGIFRYPPELAWQQAILACKDFLAEHSGYDMQIVFAVLDPEIHALGEKVLEQTMFEQAILE